jgi:hypothetical protein
MDDIKRVIRQIDSSIDDVALADLNAAFREIQQSRTDFELQHFVVGQHDTTPQQYAQCVLELQIKYNNIRRAIINKTKIAAEIDELRARGHVSDIVDCKIELKKIDIEDQDLAMLGALREFQALHRIFKSFPKQFTREELNGAQEEYWIKRLTRQANQDLMASGRVGTGNIDALRMIGRSPVPELDHIRDVEKRALEIGNVKIMIAVPTEKKAEKLPCLEQMEIPAGMQVKVYNVFGRKVDEAYNEAVRELLKDGADYLFTVEDDTFPPEGALIKLMQHMRNGLDAVCAYYPKRIECREGAPIVIGKDGKRQALVPDGELHEVFTMTMGCALIRSNLFLKTDYPWFATTDFCTQDTFFSQKLRDIGVRPMCDTSIRCKHIDRTTKEVFE